MDTVSPKAKGSEQLKVNMGDLFYDCCSLIINYTSTGTYTGSVAALSIQWFIPIGASLVLSISHELNNTCRTYRHKICFKRLIRYHIYVDKF